MIKIISSLIYKLTNEILLTHISVYAKLKKKQLKTLQSKNLHLVLVRMIKNPLIYIEWKNSSAVLVIVDFNLINYF